MPGEYDEFIANGVTNLNRGLEEFTIKSLDKLEKLSEQMELNNYLAMSANQALPEELRMHATQMVIDIMNKKQREKDAQEKSENAFKF